MENVTEGTNSSEKTDDSSPDEVASSNGEKGSDDGEATESDAALTKLRRVPLVNPRPVVCPILPPRITLDPPKLNEPTDSDSPSSSDVSSSKSGGSGFGSNRAFKLNPSRLSTSFVKPETEKNPSNSSESNESDDKTTSPLKSAPAFVPLNATNVVESGSSFSSTVSSSVAADSTSAHLTPSAAVNVASAPSSTSPNTTATTVNPLFSNNVDINSTATSRGSSTSSSSFSFVFGQNIRDKVDVMATAAVDTNEPSSTTPDPKEVTANGTSTSEMLFSAQVKSDKTNDSGGKTLSEAAREYEEARNVKRKFDEVQVLTGEEEEANVLQINCKLFAWNNNSWTERGRGTLRVNDFPNIPSQHRLIVRTAGSLRVVLNTKIWSGMTVDRASAKSMRITAMDSSGLVKVFLVMAGSKEMDQLQKCLDWRVNNLKKLVEPTAVKKTKADDNVTEKS